MLATLFAGGGCNAILGIDSHTLADAAAGADGAAGASDGLPNALLAVWGSGSSDVWAVGDAGTIVHWNGTEWSSTPGTATQSLRGLWGFGKNDVWAVGHDVLNRSGFILHWNGTVWSSNPSGTAEPLFDVWGSEKNDVWAVGQHGTILRWNGMKWSVDTSPTLPNLSTVLISRAGTATHTLRHGREATRPLGDVVRGADVLERQAESRRARVQADGAVCS